MPPWDGKPVVAPKGWTDAEIEWVPIAEIRPCEPKSSTRRRRMTEPGPTYPALVLAGKSILNGHHRYYNLVDGGWQGTVPVVRRRRAR